MVAWANKKEYAQDSELYTVTKMDLNQVVKVLGKTQLVDEQQLRFLQWGKVSKIYVKEGQSIHAGDVLAELDTKNIKNDLIVAQLNVENAQLNLSKLYDQITIDKILSAQNSVDDTKRKIQIAQQQLSWLLIEQQNKIADLLGSADQSRTSLAVTSQESSITTSSQKDIAVQSVQQYVNNATVALDNVDKFMGISQKYKALVQPFYIYIGARNLTVKYETENQYGQLVPKLAEISAKAQQFKIRNNVTTDEAIALLQQTDAALTLTKDFLQNAIAVLVYSVESSTISQTQIDSYKATTNADLNKNLADGTALKNLIPTVQKLGTSIGTGTTPTSTDLALLKAQNDFNSSQRALDLTRVNYETLVQAKRNEIQNLNSQLAIYDATLRDLQDGPLSEDTAIGANAIQSSQATLDSLLNKLQDYQLISPFDGVVRTIDFKVWDIVSSAGASTLTVENPDFYNIVVQIDQIDIVKVRVGQTVQIVFDAYPDLMITGSLSSIDPTPIEKSWVISYEAKISLSKWELVIYPSMTVNVTVLVDVIPNVIAVPSLALTTTWGKQYVDIVRSDRSLVKRQVLVGESDDGFIQILSGLKEKEIIRVQDFALKTNFVDQGQAQGLKARWNLLKIRGETIPSN